MRWRSKVSRGGQGVVEGVEKAGCLLDVRWDLLWDVRRSVECGEAGEKEDEQGAGSLGKAQQCLTPWTESAKQAALTEQAAANMKETAELERTEGNTTPSQ